MAASEAQKRAIAKWQKEKVDEVKFRVPKHTQKNRVSLPLLSSSVLFERLWNGITPQSE